MIPELKCLCCAGIGLGIIAVLVLILLWALYIVAALDRRIDGNDPTR